MFRDAEDNNFEEQSELDKLHDLLCRALQKRSDLDTKSLKAIMRDKRELSEQDEQGVRRLILELEAFLSQNSNKGGENE